MLGGKKIWSKIGGARETCIENNVFDALCSFSATECLHTASECKHFYRHDLRLGREIIFRNNFVRMEISLGEVNYIYLATILVTRRRYQPIC